LRSSQSRNHRGHLRTGTLPHFCERSPSNIALVLFLASLAGFALPQISPRPVRANDPTYSAIIVDYAYQPQRINVTTGTQVIWTYATNGKTVHTITSSPQTNTTQGGTPLISSGPLNPGQTFAYTFYKHGIYPIQCALHPTIPAMNGWVNVTGTDLQPPPPASAPPPDLTLYLIVGAAAGVIAILSLALFVRRRTQKSRDHFAALAL
jgi:plastocyanin